MDSRAKRQIVLLTLLSVAVCWMGLTSGLPNAPRSYTEGARHFWAMKTPYQAPVSADWFKYSPAFALAYYPLTTLPDRVHSFIWGFLNILLFWTGISLWFRLEKKSSRWWWLAFLFCSMEMDGPIRHLQINALLVGLMLIGLYCYREKEDLWAGMILGLGSNIKILPVFFVILLLLRPRPKFVQGLLLSAVMLFLLPMIRTGWDFNLQIHKDWIMILLSDAAGLGILDLGTVLTKLGLGVIATPARFSVLVVGLLVLGLAVWKRQIGWGWWVSLGLATILLFSPRTEQPTFVLIAPAYLFLLQPLLPKPTRYPWQFGAWGLGVVLITLMYNDIWPRFIWNPREHGALTKTLGVLVCYSLALYQSRRNPRLNA